MTLDDIDSLLILAKIEFNSAVYEMVNAMDRDGDSWWLTKTARGILIIGPSPNGIYIDWSDTDITYELKNVNGCKVYGKTAFADTMPVALAILIELWKS